MILFNNIGIIGLGLIGSSLARAIKEHTLANNIIGYSKSEQTNKKAIELGVVDKIASVQQIGKECSIVVICTPLSAYKYIVTELSPFVMGRECIVTDVGSVTSAVADIFKELLPLENHKYIVPGHPIAGTEKTGVEAGFAELFKNKKAIITPIEFSDIKAVNTVQKLWEACGSAVESMDPLTHDRIYAEVSHVPQFLAYCYAEFLKRNNDILEKSYIAELKKSKEFIRFSRICASDPSIWLDIFLMNRNNLLSRIDNFISFLPISIKKQNTVQDIAINLPQIIGAALVACSPDADKYSGSGFKDFTSYKLTNSQSINSEGFVVVVKELYNLVMSNNKDTVLRFVNDASSWYRVNFIS